MNITDCTPTQLREIATLIGGRATYNSLRHVARGRRGVSAEMALHIERAARQLGLDLRREDLASACASCEFASKCRGKVPLPKPPKAARKRKTIAVMTAD